MLSGAKSPFAGSSKKSQQVLWGGFTFVSICDDEAAFVLNGLIRSATKIWCYVIFSKSNMSNVKMSTLIISPTFLNLLLRGHLGTSPLGAARRGQMNSTYRFSNFRKKYVHMLPALT
jgi:hypothetical protein